MPGSRGNTNSQTHGHAGRVGLGAYGTPTYSSWRAMRQRCRNPKYHSYRYCGALGIEVCARWDRFENFLADMGEILRQCDMTNKQILDELGTDSMLNRVRRELMFVHAKIEQASQQKYPISVFELRRMEFEAAEKIIKIVQGE